MNEEHLNLQEPKTSKIFGVTKMGANSTDVGVIKKFQQMGYNEHEIQRKSGVHFTVVRTFMVDNDPGFIPSEAPVTAETQHLHDRIAELEAKIAGDEVPDEDL